MLPSNSDTKTAADTPSSGLGVRAALVAATAVFIGGLIAGAGAPEQSAWWASAFDAAHAPACAVFTAVALWGLRGAPFVGSRLARRYWAAAVLAGSLAVGTEWAQRFTAEGGESLDLMRDAVGIVAAMLIVAGSEMARTARAACRPPGAGLPIRLAGIALLTLSFVPLAWTTAQYVRRNAAFPLLCDFEAPWLAPFLDVSTNARLERVAPPGTWSGRPVTRVARITFLGGTYPGFVLEEPRPDWTGYGRLVLDVFSALPGPVELVLRIDDAHHDNRYEDRFNGVLEIQPGPNVVSIPLVDIRQAPRDRELDMQRIRRLVVFAVSPPRPFSLDFGPIRLER